MEKNFKQLMRTAQSYDSNEIERILGILLIVGAIREKFALAELIDAEADKIDALADRFEADSATVTADQLVEANQSAANVFNGLGNALQQINEQIEQGRKLLSKKSDH